MPYICIQAGHEGRTSGATGAPGEQEMTIRISNRVADILRSKGFQIDRVKADPAFAEYYKDFDLFLSLHGDANIYGTGGGVIASGDQSVDAMWQRSAELRDAIGSEYFSRSGIVEHKERVNANMTKYYMWSKLTAKTPCVLLEMGVVQDAHDKVLLADTEIIASAVARGVCKAFGVQYDPPAPPTEPKCEVSVEVIDRVVDINQTETQATVSLLLRITGKLDGVVKYTEDKMVTHSFKYPLVEKEIIKEVIKEVPVEVIKEVIKEVYVPDPIRQEIRDVFAGSGWWWQKYAKIKALVG